MDPMIKIFMQAMIEHGGAIGISFLFHAFTIWLYVSERRDRKAAWTAHNKVLQTWSKILGDFNTTLKIMSERLR